MFTGLVEMTGFLVGRSSSHLRISPSRHFEMPEYGESVAVNGCCLTLERELPDRTLEFFTMAETLRRTNLGELKLGSQVNLERALKLGARLGGHIVSGHIDGTGKVLALEQMPDGDFELSVSLAPELAPEVVEKGSIAIDGVSLTVVRVEPGALVVRLIPVTRRDTALAERRTGTAVNLETDILGKYVRRQLGFSALQSPEKNEKKTGITLETLHEAGFL